jgi:cellulose synthase/poly-beta-1,6-N-acetylglucosamine synthase-like glycosyltransferase
MLVLIPAHNEESGIGHTLNALLGQTRRPDRIVVICDNCTDQTEDIARRYRGVTVMATVGNTERKVGALNQGWHRWQAGYDYVMGVDADTVLDSECLGQLEDELSKTPCPGGVMARYTFDQRMGQTSSARMLIRLQRLEFAGWTSDALHRSRKTYVLGGQASLFNNQALRAVAERKMMKGPWDTSTLVEDMQLTGDLKSMGLSTNVSLTARAYAGPMLSLRSLWAQRRKWDEGMSRLLVKAAPNKWIMSLWRTQIGMLSNGITRLGFLFLLTASLMVGQYKWNYLWLIPPAVAVLLNLKLAWRVPNRTAGDLLTGALLVPVELYLIFRVFCTAASWANVLAGVKRDGWAKQHAAENGQATGAGKVLAAMAGMALAVALGLYGWLHAPSGLQRDVLTTGWALLATVTVIQTLVMVVRILRPTRGLRPLDRSTLGAPRSWLTPRAGAPFLFAHDVRIKRIIWTRP